MQDLPPDRLFADAGVYCTTSRMPLDIAKLTFKDEYGSNSDKIALSPSIYEFNSWDLVTLYYRLFPVAATRQKALSCWQERCWVKNREVLLIFFSSKNCNESLSSNTKWKMYPHGGPSHFCQFLKLTGFVFLLTLKYCGGGDYPQHWYCILFVEESFFSSCFKYEVLKSKCLPF